MIKGAGSEGGLLIESSVDAVGKLCCVVWRHSLLSLHPSPRTSRNRYLSTVRGTWKENCAVTGYGLDSYVGEVEKLLVCLCHRNRDKPQQSELSVCVQHFLCLNFFLQKPSASVEVYDGLSLVLCFCSGEFLQNTVCKIPSSALSREAN